MATTQAPPGKRSAAAGRVNIWVSWPFLTLLTAAWFSLAFHFRERAGPDVLLLGLVAAGLALVATGGRTGLLSPVFYYDLIRTARRGQLQAHRLLFIVFLAGTLFLVYLTYVPSGLWSLSSDTLRVPNRELSQFSWSFV